jgi:iron(III) transport system permease protein
VPIALGFVLPVLFMLRPLILGWDNLLWDKFLGWAWNSVWLASLSAALATALALGLAFAVRRNPHI